jgi:DnaJ-class molecular chaperone
MADKFDIYKKCPNCAGDGFVILNGTEPESPPIEQTCEICNGEGKVLWGQSEEQV